MKGIYIILLMMISATGLINAQNKDSVLELNSNWEYTHFPYFQTDEESLEKTNLAKANVSIFEEEQETVRKKIRKNRCKNFGLQLPCFH